MRILIMLAVLVPSLVAVGWLVRSRVRSRIIEQRARARRIEDERMLAMGEAKIFSAEEEVRMWKDAVRRAREEDAGVDVRNAPE